MTRLSDESNWTPPDFTDAAVIAVEGARAGIITCKRCGAAILLDPRDEQNEMLVHVEWHRALEGPMPNFELALEDVP